jgi:hypothetical protein
VVCPKVAMIYPHEYHIVELNHYGMSTEIQNWLQAQLGVGNGEHWFYRHPRIYFKNSKDHLMFLLRWS